MISIVLFLTIFIAVYAANNSCNIEISKDLSINQPLILQDVSPATLLEPSDSSGILTINNGEAIRLACTGARNHLINVDRNRTDDARAICIGEKTFQVGSSKLNVSSIVCNSVSDSTARIANETCLEKFSKIEIGFELKDGFLRIIEICRNDDTNTTYYAMARMSGAIGGYQRGYPRPYWRQDDFYKRNLNNLYKRDQQIETISRIVKSTKLGEYYVKTYNDYYYSRGHLVAKGDLVYGMVQRATFWYPNSAPQWQTFNGGNWQELEINVRDVVSQNNWSIEVYTGVHDQQTLNDENNNPQKVFFYATEDERDLVVPKYFWKVIYDPASKRGTAFVGLNDPYTDYNEDPICNNITRKITWLTWTPDDKKRGISYACKYHDLYRAIPTLPVLEITDILV